jgi:acetyl esterase/lipase
MATERSSHRLLASEPGYHDRPVAIPDLPMGAAPPGNHSLLGTELFPASSLLPDVRMPVLVPYISPGAATAVIVIPGGGFVELGTLEGEPVARAFQQRNVTALVLRYRVNGTAWPMGELPDYRNWPCLVDAQRAMAVARGRASDWGYDPSRIGIVGMSAGGALTAVLMNNLKASERRYVPVDELDDLPLRPNFLAMLYPGGLLAGGRSTKKVCMTEGKDHGSYHTCSLLFRNGSLSVGAPADMPPTFLAHARDDAAVPYQGTIALAEAIRTAPSSGLYGAAVPPVLHLFETGKHAFGVCERYTPVHNATSGHGSKPAACGWLDLFFEWLEERGFGNTTTRRGSVE